MNPVVFYILAAFTVIPVVLMIVQHNPVASAICLVAAFFGLAGLYVLLDAHFVAVIQLLVYAGAIMVLFIFVIMLLNLKEHELVHDRVNVGTVAAFLAGLALFGILLSVFVSIPRVDANGKVLSFAPVPEGYGTVREVGRLLYDVAQGYVVPFELVAILLLVGLVGAVMLGRRD